MLIRSLLNDQYILCVKIINTVCPVYIKVLFKNYQYRLQYKKSTILNRYGVENIG